MTSLIGQPLRRVEDPRLVTGTGRYVDDVQPGGLLHLAFARSPYPKARIASIDVSAARSAPGVAAVLTGEDVKALRDVPFMRPPFLTPAPHRPLAEGSVAAVGTPVAAVAAESEALARDAAALVEVDYDPQPSVANAEEALAEGAPRVHDELPSNVCYRIKREGGDVETAFAEADRIVRVKVVNPRLAGISMEPRAVLAVPEPGGGLTVWISSQAPHPNRADLATVLDVPETSIRVISPDVGGGFGMKSRVYREYVIACYLALRLKRPVKWIATRGEDMTTTSQGRDMTTDVELALKNDGTFTGLKVRNVANLGAYLLGATPVPPLVIPTMASGCYRIPNVRAESIAVYTNTVSTGPYRGAGRPEAILAIERVVDAAARELGMDPVEIRRKNFIPPDAFPYRTATGATYDSGNYAATLDRALEVAGYPRLLREREAARAGGELMGIGLSTFVEPSGGAGFESGLIRVERTGRITAITGSQTQGQGHETSFAQVVAERLHVPVDQVRVQHGDTAGTPPGVGTFGSRSMSLGGGALFRAADKVVEKARRIAAQVAEVAPDDLELTDGGFAVVGAPDRRVTWQQIAGAAYGIGTQPPGDEPGLEATVYFDPKQEMWPFGTHLAVVQVSSETGQVHLEKFVAVDDCGTVVNPLIVEGQVQGGFAQALGQGFLEQVVYGDDGTLLTGSLGDYAIPHAEDMPSLDALVLDETETPTPANPLGAKGVGEAGTNGAPPAFANAVIDALSPLGIRHLDMPYTAARVWEAIQEAKASSGAGPEAAGVA